MIEENWFLDIWQLYVKTYNKLALLWGEAQKKIAYSYLNVNYSGLKVTYS